MTDHMTSYARRVDARVRAARTERLHRVTVAAGVTSWVTSWVVAMSAQLADAPTFVPAAAVAASVLGPAAAALAFHVGRARIYDGAPWRRP